MAFFTLVILIAKVTCFCTSFFGPGNDLISDEAINIGDDLWHYALLTYDDSTKERNMYYDGQLIANDTSSLLLLVVHNQQ